MWLYEVLRAVRESSYVRESKSLKRPDYSQTTKFIMIKSRGSGNCFLHSSQIKKKVYRMPIMEVRNNTPPPINKTNPSEFWTKINQTMIDINW